MRELFHPAAPSTVRLGAVGTALLAVADAFVRIRSAQLAPGDVAPSTTLFRVALGLAVGLAFAWGIARMRGVFYWCWFALSLFIIAVVLVPLIWRLASGASDVGAITIGSEGAVIGVVWLVTATLLLALSSIRAFVRQSQ